MTAVRELHKRYGDLVALDGAAFVVSAGRILGFLGTNGVGKTTTKEITAAVLADRWRVLKNEANYNNEIGLPLTLLLGCRNMPIC